jgi:predicted nicotinamide N-methyase
VGGRDFELLGPDTYESLLNDPEVIRRFGRDEYMPYWADFWPASVLLAEQIARRPQVGSGRERPPTVLEPGCGLGLVALAALERGCRVIATDYEEQALQFARLNARHNGLPEPETRLVDWRRLYPDLRPDRIVASEVLYEGRNLRPVAEFVRDHLAPDGRAFLIDSYRRTADAFPAVARDCGLATEVRDAGTIESGACARTVSAVLRGRLFELTRA